MDARDGKILTTLPIGTGVDGAGFMPATKEAFSSQGDGTLTVIKETSPTAFDVEQTVKTMPSAKTMTIDSKTGHIYLIAAEFGPAPSPEPGNNVRAAVHWWPVRSRFWLSESELDHKDAINPAKLLRPISPRIRTALSINS